MKLISMREFVLEQIEVKQSTSEFKETIVNYAKFLSQPLTLGMFVPVDEEGNVLSEPEMYYRQTGFDEVTPEYDAKEVEEYQQAKERVLFEGFEILRSGNFETENPFFVVSNGENEITFHIGLYNFSKGVEFARIIEDLTPIKPELTQQAIKQITS